MGSFIERIQYFMSQMGINNNQMTVTAGLSVGLIGRAIKSKSGLNSDSIEKILYAYPNLNPNWLLTGRGEMLINNKAEKENSKVYSKVNGKDSSESSPKEAPPSLSIATESTLEHRSQRSNDDISGVINGLIERIQDLSEEIGALKQENFMLKHRLEEIADSAPDVNTAHG